MNGIDRRWLMNWNIVLTIWVVVLIVKDISQRAEINLLREEIVSLVVIAEEQSELNDNLVSIAESQQADLDAQQQAIDAHNVSIANILETLVLTVEILEGR